MRFLYIDRPPVKGFVYIYLVFWDLIVAAHYTAESIGSHTRVT